MSEVQKLERKLAFDKYTQFRGTARIRFQNLRFIHIHDRKRDNEKLESELRQRYERQGCLRLEPKNHIPAIIDDNDLGRAINNSPGVSRSHLLRPPRIPVELKLPSDFLIECLDGCLRVEAGKQYLPRKDWWWTIDLYLKV